MRDELGALYAAERRDLARHKRLTARSLKRLRVTRALTAQIAGKAKHLFWCTVTFLMAGVVDDGTTLVVIVAEDLVARTFDATAFESRGASLKDVYAKHRHAIIGEGYRTLRQAKRAAERYAKKWKRDRNRRKKRACACTPIRVKGRAA